MADPLSISSGIIGALSLAIQVTGALVNFYTSYKDQYVNTGRTRKKLENLLSIFQNLETELQKRSFDSNAKDLLKDVEESICSCDELVQELQEELNKFKKPSTAEIKDAIKMISRRCAYPFRESTLKKLDEAVGEIRGNLSVALDVLHVKD